MIASGAPVPKRQRLDATAISGSQAAGRRDKAITEPNIKMLKNLLNSFGPAALAKSLGDDLQVKPLVYPSSPTVGSEGCS